MENSIDKEITKQVLALNFVPKIKLFFFRNIFVTYIKVNGNIVALK